MDISGHGDISESGSHPGEMFVSYGYFKSYRVGPRIKSWLSHLISVISCFIYHNWYFVILVINCANVWGPGGLVEDVVTVTQIGLPILTNH